MHIKSERFNAIRSLMSLILAAAIIFGSVFTVAAAVQANAEKDTALLNSDITAEMEMSNGDLVIANLDQAAFSTEVIKALKIKVNYFGKIQTVNLAKGTIADVLEKAGIVLEGKNVVEPSLDTQIRENMIVKVYEGKKISVKADGKTESIYVPKGKTVEVLNDFGYKISKDDILNVKKDSEIWNADKIVIKRVAFGEETVAEVIDFEVVNHPSDKVELGETKLKTKGAEGKQLVTSRCKYVDGKKVSSKAIDKKVIKKAVNKVVLVGTKGASTNGGAGTFTDMYGNKIAYKRVHTGSGTAYTAPAGSGTATGVRAYHGGVAVNPNIIPYGSKLYIESTDGSFVYGYATAVDTGGALMSGSAIVDCFYDTYNECVNFGRRNVNVYVIA